MDTKTLLVGTILKVPGKVTTVLQTIPTPTSTNLGETVSNIPLAPPVPTKFPEIYTYQNSARFTFKDLGEREFVLYYPQAKQVVVDLPNQWMLQYGVSFIDLHYDIFEQESNTISTLYYGGILSRVEHPYVDVYINDYLAGTFDPEIGKDHWSRLYFPTFLMEDRPFNPTNTYSINIQYYRNNDIYCGYAGTISIHEDSSVNLQFSSYPPYLNLPDFPYPMVQDSFLPETLLIIIPDSFTEIDLAAAANVAATIGKKTGGNITLKVITASQATPQMLADSNAIAIGQPDKNTFIKQLYSIGLLPTMLSLQGPGIIGPTGQQLTLEDGVLQLVRSTTKEIYTYLVITGNSDKAIDRAVKALANPPIGMKGNLAIIGVEPNIPIQVDETIDTFFFSDFGFRERTFFGIDQAGSYYGYLRIFIPRDWEIIDDVILYINYDISANLGLHSSALNIELNGSPIGSVPLNLNPGEKQVAIPIRAHELRLGYANTFRFEAIITGPLDCAQYNYRAFWMKISDKSVIKIPHRILTAGEILPPFIHPLFYLTNTSDVFISMPVDPTSDELYDMTNLVFQLGRQMTSTYYNFSVSLNPNLDPASQIGSDAIVIGRPTRNPLIGKFNDVLPQPFVPGEDTLTLKQQPGFYRIQQDADIGIVEVIPAPWDPLLGITIVTGTTDKGLRYAAEKVANATYLYDFAGDISFAQENRIDAFQSTKPPVKPMDVILATLIGKEVSLATVMPTEAGTAVVGTPATPSVIEKYEPPTKPGEKTSPVLTYAIYAIAAIGVVLLILAIVQAIRGGRRR
ncbi:MAG: cellulose biosynthesis cyclic di-GMP-binding regulatory protein BcsB [Anaerolineales bacterium]|nr:cellulose biosynthesis cyclic di-GMP-binding regulatory protein BcsB [Anaerolineales bacterium]